MIALGGRLRRPIGKARRGFASRSQATYGLDRGDPNRPGRPRPVEKKGDMSVDEAWPIARPGAILNSAGVGAGVALALLAAGASAKTLSALAPQPSQTTRPATPRANDGLSGGGFYLEADTLAQNQATHHILATGDVEARYKGRVIRAQSLDYDSQTGVVIARGNVRIVQADGTAQFADVISLDKTMSEGFATGFSTRMQANVRIAAQSAERKPGQVTEFHHVIYTPCAACVDHGQKRPTWSIRARSVTEDKKRERLVFRGAVIQVLGQEVLYLPVIESADPTAERKSGLLVPQLTFSGPRGVSYEQPYYITLSDSQDLLITPQINGSVNPFLNVDWRKRFYSGTVELRGGYTYDQDFTSGGDRFGPQTSRSYILGNGSFILSPVWSWGFTAEQASDKLIFAKYSVTDVYATSLNVDRGLYAADDQRLISQLYAVRQDTNSYLSVAAISVQGLRSTDRQGTFPTIAPLIEGRWEAPEPVLGGRLRVEGSAVALTRDQSFDATDATGQTLLPGVDSRTATLQADWQRSLTFDNGLLLQPFINGRADVFNLNNVQAATQNPTLTRAFGTLGANISYPLIRQAQGVTWVLEPQGQIAISPNVTQDPRIPNEDSVDWQFDETNLFQTNRSPGTDLYEGGQSITLAGRATAILDDGRSASLLIGRRLAAESSPAVPARTGLQTALSDWVFAADATPLKNVRLFSRLRLDSSSFIVNSLEAGAVFNTSRVEGSVSYLRETQAPTGGPVDSLDIHTALYATDHWGVTNYFILDDGTWRRTEVGLVYRDDCLRVEVIYRHDETFNGTLGPSTSVVIRVKLATLGNTR
jgi:LPS-assembly protein